jgi:hypothetical protein
MPAAPIACTCPSCAGRLTIKDPSLVGKRIRCPKCKEPFTVEASADVEAAPVKRKAPPAVPAPPRKSRPRTDEEDEAPPSRRQRSRSEDEEEEERPAKKKRKKKKKKANNLPLLIGGGAAALVAIGVVVAVIVMNSGGSSSSSGQNTGPKVQRPPLPSGWNGVTGQDAEFEAYFPGKAEYMMLPPSPAGGKRYVVYHTVPGTTKKFNVMADSVPVEGGKPLTLAEIAKKAIEGDKAKDPSVTVAGERDLMYDSIPAKEFTVRSNNTMAKFRMMVVNNRVFALVVVGTESELSGQDVQQFLDLFQPKNP